METFENLTTKMETEVLQDGSLIMPEWLLSLTYMLSDQRAALGTIGVPSGKQRFIIIQGIPCLSFHGGCSPSMPGYTSALLVCTTGLSDSEESFTVILDCNNGLSMC